MQNSSCKIIESKEPSIWATRVALIFGCVFVKLLISSLAHSLSLEMTATHLSIERFCVVFRRVTLYMYAFDITAPFASNNAQYHFHWCCRWAFVFFSLFTGHACTTSSNSSSSTNILLMMWTSEYYAHINTVFQCILTNKSLALCLLSVIVS